MPATSVRSWQVIKYAVLLALLAAGACYFLWPPAIDRSRIYRIGYGNDAPMHYPGPDGKPAGLAVDIVQEAARRSGIKLDWIVGRNFDPKTMDLWVLLTILPERMRTMHFSDPYLQIASCFIVRADSRFQQISDLGGVRISCTQMPVVTTALAREIPSAVQASESTSEAVIDALNEGRVDAAFVDEYVVVSESLLGKVHVPFRILSMRSSKRYLAVAATPACATVADEIRRAMQSMPGDLTYPLNRWTFYASPVTDTIEDYAVARRRSEWLLAGVVTLSVITALTIGLAIRSRLQAAKLRQTEEFLREIADRVPGVVFQYRLNPDGTSCFPYASEAIRRIFRVSPESVRQDAGPVRAVVHPDDLGAMEASLRESAQRLTPWTHEYRVRFDKDTIRWLSASAVPHREPNGATLWHGVITDTTEQRRLQLQAQQSQRMESIGTLASGIAHDFNNILTPISMSVDLLQTEVGSDEARTLLAMVREAARHGASTVRQLLTMARGADVEKSPVQVRYVIKEVSDLLKRTFPKDIQLYTDYDQQTPLVKADPSQLHQVVMNLCVNARDAMPEGGVIFIKVLTETFGPGDVGRHPKARPIPYVVIAITDSGTGIPAEVADRIFDPFFTTKPQGKGTGLGLATVLGIVEEHGGFVLVESTVGKGATFRAYLPAALESAAAVPAELKASPVSAGRGELILVVEDEVAILHVATEILQRNGYTTLRATSSSEALGLYEQYRGQMKAVLTDIMMPFGDGRRLITVLREQDPALTIIAMSGLATKEFQHEILLKGASGFLPKPFQAADLLQILGRLLK